MKTLAYFGTYTNSGSQGIYRAEVDMKNGVIGGLQTAARIPNPSFLSVDTSGFLLSCVETNNFQNATGGGIISFRIMEDGSIVQICAENTRGTCPCHICIGEKSRAVFVSNYGSGSLCVFKMDGEGKLFYVKNFSHKSQTLCGKQYDPHVHCSILTEDEQKAYVCDLGINRIMVYNMSMGVEYIELEDEFEFPAGSGPRHAVLSEDKNLLYVVCELSNELIVASSVNGEILQRHSLLPENTSGFSAAASIYLCRNAGLLATSIRGADCIRFFTVRNDGLLDKSALIQLNGKYPRDMYLSPDGCSLLVAYEKSNFAELLLLDGSFNYKVLGQIEIPSPTRICFFIPLS